MSKRKTPSEVATSTPIEEIPKSFVFRNGKVGKSIYHLIADVRQLMLPYTAERLKETKQNKLRDFIDVATLFGVTHFISFSQSEFNTNCRIIRCPRGPTLTFRVVNFSLMSDIIALQKRPHSPGNEFNYPPLVVLNNFGGNDINKQLMAATFQAMFPPISIETVKLTQCRRVVLFSYDNENNVVNMRHYIINASPVGVTKTIKKLFKGKLPNLSNYDDIANYALDNGGSDSENDESSRVELPQDFGNVKKHSKSAIKLQEMGPRLCLKLIKIEEHVCTGTVLYHSYIKKTQEEIDQLAADKKKKIQLKKQRKEEQERNVAAKKAAKKGTKNNNEENDDSEDDQTRIKTEDESDDDHVSENDEDDLDDMNEDSFINLEDNLKEEEEDEEEDDVYPESMFPIKVKDEPEDEPIVVKTSTKKDKDTPRKSKAEKQETRVKQFKARRDQVSKIKNEK